MRAYFKSIGLVAGLTLGTNLLGFLREMLFARVFGATNDADTYITAFSIVAMCFLVFSGGALQGAFMPRYQSKLVCGELSSARAFWNSTFFPLSAIFLGVMVILIAGAGLWVDLVVPGFNTEQKQLTIQIIYWLSPMVFLVGVGSLSQSVVHAHEHFLLPALVPLFNNITIIIFLLIVVPSFGIYGLAVGTLLGATIWLTLLPLARKFLPTFKPIKDSSAIRDLFHGMTPLIILLVADQASALFQKNIVSDLEAGSIAVLNYATRLEALPVGIFAAAIAAVFFPALVDAISRNDTEAIKARFNMGIRAVFFCAVPATVFLIMNSQFVVKVLFERGAFDANATLRSADALVYYAAGLVPQCLIVFINRVYFAAGDTRTPMKKGVFSAGLHVIFCWVLVNEIGYLGVAAGTTLYAVIYVVLLFVGLPGVFRFKIRAMWKSIWRSLVGGSVMVVFYMQHYFEQGFFGFLFSIIIGGTVYLIIAWLLCDPVLFDRKAPGIR